MTAPASPRSQRQAGFTHPTRTLREMELNMAEQDQVRRRVDEMKWRPRNVVWEITLACNLKCGYCGSRAGAPRADELRLDECLRVVDELAALDCELITLSGGEPTMRPDWPVIARAIADKGIHVNMVTNGVYKRHTAQEVARQIKDAGMCNVGVSIDGPEEIHDALRGRGTFAQVCDSVRTFVAEGLSVTVMSTIGQRNFSALAATHQLAQDLGARMWRVQLAKPMGSMADAPDLLLPKGLFLQLIDQVAAIKKSSPIQVRIGDSIGYFGPHDKTLRARSWRHREQVWRGCQAGLQSIGIEANGAVKGCLSLQASLPGQDFIEGNLREESLATLWYRPDVFRYNRQPQLTQLTGKCGVCKHGQQCRGGAKCVAAAVTGALSEDPYCYYGLTEAGKANTHPIKEAAAAAAAAAVLIGAFPACEYGLDDPDDVEDLAEVHGDVIPDAPDTNVVPEYAVEPDVHDDQIAIPEYGVEPDMHDDTVTTDYGVEPDIIDDAVVTEYGVEPDVIEDAIGTDYGVEPDATDDFNQNDYGVPVP